MQRYTTTLALIAGTVLLAAACQDGNGGGPKPPSPGPGTSKVMKEDVQAFFEAEERGVKPGAVFVFYENGRIQAFRRSDQRSLKFERPLPAKEVLALESIAIIKTSNPKYCWRNSDGSEECVTY